MRSVARTGLGPALLAALCLLLLPACSGGDDGLSQADVEEVVRKEIAAVDQPTESPSAAEVEEMIQVSLSAMPAPQAGLTAGQVEQAIRAAIADMPQGGVSRAEVEEMIRAAVAAMPEGQGGLTSAEAESIARGVVASIPSRSSPAEYTRFVVNSAVARYETQGLEATLAHYSHKESIDGQWYVFIIGEDDRIVAHPDPHRVGLDVKGWVGTDTNGYNFAPEMLSATDEGKWVSYVFANPESGDFGPDHAGAMEYKHVWVVRHDGLLFASGWYVPADEYTRFVVDEAIARYQAEGLEETLAYYSSIESVDGQWYVFVATPEGEIVGHYNAEGLAVHLQEMLDDGSFKATGEGVWVNHEDVNPATGEVEDKHFWLVEIDGLVFGSGWHHDVSGG